MASIDELADQIDATLSMLESMTVAATVSTGEQLTARFASLSAQRHTHAAQAATETVEEVATHLAAVISILKDIKARAVAFRHSTGAATMTPSEHAYGRGFRLPRLGVVRPDRAEHILHGDADNPRSGGHLAGTGRSGKTEFPRAWDRTKILAAVSDVAINPDKTRRQPNGWHRCEGVRDGVSIRVVVGDDGGVITAHPTKGPGVKKNRSGS